jgi:hypothetical protein
MAPATTGSSLSPKTGDGGDNNSDDTMITFNENVRLTKDQHQALKIVCDISQLSFAEYIQYALVQTMQSDIDDGNIAISLLEMLDDGSGEKENEKSSIDEGKASKSVLDELMALNKLSNPT